MKLDNRVIIVTGASRGLGEKMVRAFCDEGASVVCASRSEGAIEKLAGELSEDGSALAVPTDVRSEQEIQYLVDKALSHFGRIDVFVNNAGVAEKILMDGKEPPVSNCPPEVWRTVIETNLTGPFLCSKAVLPPMLNAESGRIIHISSGLGKRPFQTGLPMFRRNLVSKVSTNP